LAYSIDNPISAISNIDDEHLYTINNSFKKHYDFPVELKKNVYKNILLLGATGYLGIHILRELLTTTSSTIYCIVRSINGSNSQKRLYELYNYYFNEDLSKESRLKTFDSNVLDANFGLDIDTYNFLQKNINIAVNCVANVKYYGETKLSTDTNVNLTKALIDFCISGDIKFVYISTLGVSGNFLVSHKNLTNIFTEDDFYIKQNYTENIYINTKFEAEKIIYYNVNNGLNATIFRVGNLTGRYSDGVFQKNIKDNAFYNMLKLILSSKIIPESFIDKTLEFTPVDLCASAISKLIFGVDSDYRVFHLFNNNYITIKIGRAHV
jgi:fengycin family lipopeptide synthetase D